MGISGQIDNEFKFHNNVGGYAYAEYQGKDADPEARHLFVAPVAGFQEHAFHDHQDQPQAYAERRIDIMKGNGKCELNACQHFNIHRPVFVQR